MRFVYFTPCYILTGSSYVKLFGKAQVDVNLSLGQFVKVNSRLLFLILFCFIYSEIYERGSKFFSLSPQSRNIDNEFDFQQLAYFKTRIGVSNSFQVRKTP